MMRILLTGIAGQIGGALLRPLQSLGHVIGADRTLLDFSRPDSLPHALDALRPDLIVNLAGYTAVDRAESERELAFTVNATAPAVLARWAAENGAPIVHFSTDYVFDGSGERPWREDDAANPLSVYGHSKLVGENAVRAAGGSHLIIRASWVYATSGTNFLQKIIKQASGTDKLRVVNDQFGAPTSAQSIAEIISKIIPGDKASVASRFSRLEGVVHIASSGTTTRHEFATAILHGLSQRDNVFAGKTVVPISSAELAAPAVRPRNSRLDLSRLENTLGVTMPHWQTSLDDQLNRLTTLALSPAR